MAEFKISRLRFSWKGEWVDLTTYKKDEIVQYEGKAYVCLVPHDSAGFYSDLGDIIPKWQLMMTGQTWKGPWEQFATYSLDNIVIFGGIVYKCNTQHVAGAVLDTDIAKWDVYAESKTWQSEWTVATAYGIGDIIQYGGSAYECIISHTSAATDAEGLEADYYELDSTLVKWKLTNEGVQWSGEFSDLTEDSSIQRYKLGDIVKYGPSVYKCIEGHVPEIPEVPVYGVYTSTLITPFGGTIDYQVSVAGGTNSYGTGNKYYIQGQAGVSPTLSLVRGLTYKFDQSASNNATHQLRFSTTPNGTWGGGVEYTVGVVKVGTAGSAGAYTQITVADDAPALYYYCVNHSGMGGTAISPGASTYTITPVASTIDEGSTLTINVATANVINGTTLYWSASNAGDFGTSTGNFTITNNAGSFTITPTADITTETLETFTIQLRTESASGTIVSTSENITINDTSQAPSVTYTASSASNNVDEGSTLTINVATANVADATTLYWTVTNDGDFTTSSGNFTITSNAGSFTVTPNADTTTEGPENFDVQIRTGSTIGTIVNTLGNIIINDTSLDAVVTADFTINVLNTGSSAYLLSGADRNGNFSQTNKNLTFNDGDIVDFVVNASGHPFYIKTQQTTGANDQAAGVLSNGEQTGTVQWTISGAGTYYYICEFHAAMFGTITV